MVAGPFDDISMRLRMSIVEYLLSTMCFCCVLEVLKMILASLLSKVTGPVHQVVLPYMKYLQV
jgi:hypothetical protein